jgi:putative GTP pyrophosphokinase
MALAPLARAIEGQLCEYFATGPHIDRVTARPKSVERFLAKAQTYEHEKLKYSEPLRQIQDQVEPFTVPDPRRCGIVTRLGCFR